MKISYKGVPTVLSPKLQDKLDAKFAKLSKLLEKRGEKEAHVVVTSTRHLHRAEITIQFYDHQLVAIESDADLFNAMNAALAKLEKQALKQRTRWREKSRRNAPSKDSVAASATPTEKAAPSSESPKIFRVNHHERRKPITLEEAVIQMEGARDYMVYRDADKECVSVLIRRKDGNFDLIES